jgi:ubiquinone/menaquinone biosynthesis C-methylase UbiE
MRETESEGGYAIDLTTFGPTYYAEHADQFGWGPHSATLDAERAEYLNELVIGSVLDVGCGTGIYVDFLARAGHDAHGVDYTEPLIRFAQERHLGRFTVADAYALPFPDASIDTVMALDLLEHVDDIRVLKEMKRVARRRVIVVVPATAPPELEESGLLYRHYVDQSHVRYYGEEDVRALYRNAGMAISEARGVAPVDFDSFVRRTLSFPSALLGKAFFKTFFTVFRVLSGWRAIEFKRYFSEWLILTELTTESHQEPGREQKQVRKVDAC